MAVEISPQQFRTFQEANGQFCNIPTPFQPLTNPPSCIIALYAKNTASISTRCSLQIRKSSDVSMLLLFSHTGVCVMAIGSLVPAGLGIFCCYFFWCHPTWLVHWPLQPGTIQYTIVDEDVEAAPIYRCNSKASQPMRPHENHGLHIEHTYMDGELM